MVKVDTSPENKARGNEADDNNVGQRISDGKLNRSRKGYDETNPARPLSDAEKAAVAGLEDSYSNPSMSDEERLASVGEREEAGSKGPSYYADKIKKMEAGGSMLRKLWRAKSGKPTAVISVLLFVFGVGMSMMGGASFWYSLEKNLTNENANDTGTNILGRRAFNKMIAGGSCGTSSTASLLCKFRTATKSQIEKWKDGKWKVKGKGIDSNGKPTGQEGEIDPDKMKDGERVQITEVDAPDDTRLKSGAELNNYTDTNPKGAAYLEDVSNSRTTDFNEGSTFEEVLEKGGLSKASSEDPKQEKITEDTVKSEAKAAQEKTADSLGKRAFRALGGAKGLTAVGAVKACQAYSMINITVSAIKAKYILDLTRFAWPFLQIISKTIEGKHLTQEDYQKIRDRLTQLTEYMSVTQAQTYKSKVDSGSLTDSEKETLAEFGIATDYDDKQGMKQQIDDIAGKNALDSQGLKMAIYGDNTGLTEMTKKFSTAAIGTTGALASMVQGQLNSIFSFGFGQKTGKANIKTACIAVKAYLNGTIVANISECIAEGAAAGSVTLGLGTVGVIIKCLGEAAASVALWEVIGMIADDLIKLGIGSLVGYGLDKLTLNSDLKGPAAGNALAAGIGLILMKKSQSSGLKPAMSLGAIDSFLVSTGKYVNAYGDQVAMYKARSTPFDTSNRYSFMGQIISAISPYGQAGGATAFSYLSNIFGTLSNGLVLAPAANALHSQPVLLTNNEATLNSRTNNGVCPDTQKKDAGMMCDWNGQAISITSPRVIQWMQEDASGKTDHLAEVIKWMQTSHDSDEGQDANSGTNDKTCDGLAGIATQVNQVVSSGVGLLTGEKPDFSSLEDCWNSGSKASIDEQGKTVSGSQFEKYINYCTGNRSLDMGSTDVDESNVSAREAAWHDGTQCALSYDCHGNASTDDGFDKNCDTGNGSYMMDAFAYYYNMCYVQYAVANGATDCTNDTPPNSGGGGAPATGSIAEVAKQMGTWGAQYQACYKYGNGHGETGSKEWIQQAIANHFTGQYAVDCSAFVRAVILQATGNDIGPESTSAMCADTKNFEHISRGSAQPGDLAIDCANHVEVVVANNNGTFQTVGARSDGCGPGNGASPGNFQGVGDFVLRYKG